MSHKKTSQLVVASVLILFGHFCGPVSAEPLRELSKGVSFGDYSPRWPRSVFMKVEQPAVQAVIAPNFGGRIIHFSLNGKNVLLDKSTGEKKENFFVGGYQCDIGPELRDLPAHLTLLMGINGWQHKPYVVRVLGDPDKTLGVSVEKEMRLDSETGVLSLMQRMKNTSKTNVSYCIWDRTVCKPGGFALLPLNPASRFKKGWTVHNIYNGSFVFDGEQFVSAEVKAFDDVVVALCNGEPTKIAADSDAGWIAYALDDLLFVKYFPYFPKSDYSDGGNSIELYFDHGAAELQVVSPEIELAPEENYGFPEKWTLIQLDEPVKDFEGARKLLAKIKPSPFTR